MIGGERMLCEKCGSPIDEGGRFCPVCGAPVGQAPVEQAPVEQAQAQVYAPPQVKKKSGLWWKIAIPVVVIAAAAIVAWFMFFRNVSSLITIRKAFINMSAEVSQRIDGTPLKAVPLLLESLNDGKVTVDFDYRDSWFGKEARGAVIISSSAQDREGVIAADIFVNGTNFDLETYINRDRIAARSRLLGDKFYGFRYSTFRSDIRGFGELIGLDDETMNMLADIVDTINDAMNTETGTDDDGMFSGYTHIITSFFESMEMTSEKTEIDAAGGTVKCTRTDFVISEDAVIKLLNDLYDELKNDKQIREQFESGIYDQLLAGLYLSYAMGGNDRSRYDEFLDELKTLVRDFERYYTGSITFSVFTGRGDRLLRMEVNADIKYDGERIGIRESIDFGASMQDRWTINATVINDDNRSSARIVWDYRIRANSVENSLTITADGEDPVKLTSLWLKNNGDFRLSYEDRWDEGEITGAFIEDEKGFRLELDDLTGDPDTYLTIKITAVNGVEIDSIEFINLDRWGEALIEDLADVINNLSDAYY